VVVHAGGRDPETAQVLAKLARISRSVVHAGDGVGPFGSLADAVRVCAERPFEEDSRELDPWENRSHVFLTRHVRDARGLPDREVARIAGRKDWRWAGLTFHAAPDVDLAPAYRALGDLAEERAIFAGRAPFDDPGTLVVAWNAGPQAADAQIVAGDPVSIFAATGVAPSPLAPGGPPLFAREPDAHRLANVSDALDRLFAVMREADDEMVDLHPDIADFAHESYEQPHGERAPHTLVAAALDLARAGRPVLLATRTGSIVRIANDLLVAALGWGPRDLTGLPPVRTTVWPEVEDAARSLAKLPMTIAEHVTCLPELEAAIARATAQVVLYEAALSADG
jgi:hypothetical protein